MTEVGIIGGSGLYALDGMISLGEERIDTPFGAPSDALLKGTIDDIEVVFLPRHGRGHRLLPSEVPYRANIYAMKQLGVRWLISVSAVGSMKQSVEPGHMVLPDQFIDRTHRREATFFGAGLAAHVSIADPTCPALRSTLADAITGEGSGTTCHRDGTYICIEGPAFSTRAESHTYRQWNIDIIGMTAMPEAKLAREAELHYATIALVTDYDCWHEGKEAVNASAVVETMKKNTDNVKRALAQAIPKIAKLSQGGCDCDSALGFALMTDPKVVPKDTRDRLKLLVAKYL